MMRIRSKNRRGFTLVEVMVASVVSVVVLTSTTTLFITVLAAWARGETSIDTESETRELTAKISDELREAMLVTVDADGMGVTYHKPQKDVSGDFSIPIVWDGVTRRIFLSGTELRLQEGGITRVLSKTVLQNDPFLLGSNVTAKKRAYQTVAAEGAPAYQIFVPNSTSLVSEVTVTIVNGAKGGRPGEWSRAKKRDRVVLRNVPELIK